MKGSGTAYMIKEKGMVINSDYHGLLHKAGLDSFARVWQCDGGNRIKIIRERSVTRMEIIDGVVLYLKRHNRRFIGLKRRSDARIEFENILAFKKNGLPTLTPVAMGERFVHFFWVESFLVTRDFSPFVTLENLLKKPPDFLIAQKKLWLKEIAVFARRMHQAGFNHQDFNANHVLIHYRDDSSKPAIATFDLQRVNRRKFLRFRWAIKALSELSYTLPDSLFDKDDRIFLFKSYKGKDRLNVWDLFQLSWIERKALRIGRHTEKRRKEPSAPV